MRVASGTGVLMRLTLAAVGRNKAGATKELYELYAARLRWQLTLKDTSLISVVGLVEIMRQASVASGSTQKPFTFYLTAGVLYLVLTAFSNKGFGLAELWANRGVRRA